MGITTVTTARILRGQLMGQNGEETELAFDKFENVALSKTYNTDSQVGDSGACATALLCGVKSRFETIGLDDNAIYDKCFSSFTSRITCLTDWAQQEGKATGVVTTTRVTHATPAAAYGHVASRYWESDDKMPEDAKSACKDLARQLVEDEPGQNINCHEDCTNLRDTHGGEDVPVYAHGPMSHLFRGVFEQTYIPHAMAYAACIGPEKDNCHTRMEAYIKRNEACPPAELRSQAERHSSSYSWIIILICTIMAT
ncbi:alkaline phosphatase, tissue-nonspecific isozyme-like [Centruroides sculpturatus]|uniref:alkaline phosphatase, tissue-nonspecific isozyme-like n=1 Tax=Centruroides sculpturatus TaxID=218467 RepID=UPI000C6DFB21|nr:alkaline phosphatase, tissue-nonspecific isozyme-like [Centruroides sculpturatus]